MVIIQNVFIDTDGRNSLSDRPKEYIVGPCIKDKAYTHHRVDSNTSQVTKKIIMEMRKSQLRLFVIIDPTRDHQIALEKALSIARSTECSIHAYLCVYEDINEHSEYASIKDMKYRALNRAQKRIDFLMQPCHENQIHYTTEVLWDKYWYKPAVDAATRSGADLVIKSSFHHSKAKRFFNKTSDYSLMRYCTNPILFTHKPQQLQGKRVLACVDLESGDTQHNRLNNRIIQVAKTVAEALNMGLTIATAYEKKIDSRLLQGDEFEMEDASAQLGKIFDIEPQHIILRQGSAAKAIEQICTEISPALLVIGSIARAGFSGTLIGNTAEKLLDVIDADILTIT